MAEIVIDIRSNNAESRLNSLRSNFQRTDRAINETTGSIGRLNSGIVGLIGTIGGLTLAKSAFDSIQTGFKSLENLTLEVSKTTGLAGEDLKRLTSELDKMSTTMGGFEVKGLYQIAESAGQLGVHGVENLKTFTKEMQYMASSSKLTAQDASVGFAEIANALNLPISEINKLTSSFSKLASTTTADEAKLLDFTQRLAGAGKTLGLTNAQIVAVGATMKDVGVNVEVGGTAMSQVFQKMLKDTESFAKVSHVSLSEYSKMIDEKPVKALELFLSSLGKLDKRAKIKALDDMKMSGSGLSSTLLKLSSNTKKLEANIKTSSDAYVYGKATLDEYKVSSESLTAQQQKAESAVLLLQKAIGDELKPMMLSLNESTVDGIHWMQENTRTLKNVGIIVGTVTASYYALTTAQKINTAWTTGAGAVGLAKNIAGLNAQQLLLIGTIGYTKALNVAMRATPWGLAITGATGLALALNNVFETEKRRAKLMDEYVADTDNRERKASLKAYNKELKDYNGTLKANKKLEEMIGSGKFNEAQIKGLKKSLELNKERAKTLKENLVWAKESAEFDGNSFKKTAEIAKKSSTLSKESAKEQKKYSTDIVNSLKSIGTQSKATATKVSSSMSKSFDDTKRKLKDFENTYNRSVMDSSTYQLHQLDIQKKAFEADHMDKVKIAKWYSAEKKKIEDERIAKAKSDADKIARIEKDRISTIEAEAKKAREQEEQETAKRLEELESFTTEWKKATMNRFDLEAEKLKEQKKLYIQNGIDRVKIDEWYSVEFGKIEDERIAKSEAEAKKIADAEKEKIKAFEEAQAEKQKVLEDFSDKLQKLTLSDFKYSKIQLEKEKKEWIESGIEKIEAEKLYAIEYQKILEEKQKLEKEASDKIAQENAKAWEDANAKQKEAFETYQEEQKKKIEGEVAYQDLLGNFDYGDELKYEKKSLWFKERGKDVSVEQIKALEKQREIQGDIANLFNDVLNGESLTESYTKFYRNLESDNLLNLSEMLSEKVAKGFKDGFDKVDFSITDKNGNLTDFGTSIGVGIGNMGTSYFMNKNQDSSRQQTGTAVGSMVGSAVGAYWGAVGSAIGGAIGAGVGGAISGGKRYKYAEVIDGDLDYKRYTSGGMFRSNEHKKLLKETYEIRNSFNNLTDSYSSLLEDLTGITEEFTIKDGKYKIKDLTENFADEFFNAWAGIVDNSKEIDVITGRNQWSIHSNNLNDYLDPNQFDIEDTRSEVDKMMANTYGDDGTFVQVTQEQSDRIKTLLAEQAKFNSQYTEAEINALNDRKEELQASWTNYAESVNATVSEALSQVLGELEMQSMSIAEFNLGDDKEAILNLRANDLAEKEKNIEARLKESLNDENFDLNIDSYNEYLEALKKTPDFTAEVALDMKVLGQVLLASGQNAKELGDAKEAQAQAEIEAQEKIAKAQREAEQSAIDYANALYSASNAMSASISSIEDYVAKKGMGDLKALEYDKKNLLDDLGLNDVTLSNYKDKVGGMFNQDMSMPLLEDGTFYGKDFEDKANSLAQLLIQEDQLKNKQIETTKESVKTTTEAIKELLHVSDSLESFKEFYKTFGMEDDEKLLYDIEKANLSYSESLKNVGLESVTGAEYIERYNYALENGLSDEQVKKWDSLGDAMRDATNAQQAYIDSQKEYLKTLDDSKDNILSNIESLIRGEIDSLRSDYKAQEGVISSLQDGKSKYSVETQIYSHDIYGAIGIESADKVTSMIDTWASQQISSQQKVIDKQNEAEKNRVDTLNKEIELSNKLRETILSMQDATQSTFDDIRGLSSDSQKQSIMGALSSKEYDKVNSLFSSFAKDQMDNAGYFGEVDALVEVAKMNQQIQNVNAPTEQSLIEPNIIEIKDFTEKINLQAEEMYNSLIATEQEKLPLIQDEINGVIANNMYLFDKGTDIYSYLERGATELTFEEKMTEQKNLLLGVHNDRLAFYKLSSKNQELNTMMLDRQFTATGIKLTNNTNDITSLQKEMSLLRKDLAESNKRLEEIAREQLEATKETANNTKDSGIAT